VPQAQGGGNSYRNLVSCCVDCNSQKGEQTAEEYLRWLFRGRRLSDAELGGRLRALDDLAAGKLRPDLLENRNWKREKRKTPPLRETKPTRMGHPKAFFGIKGGHPPAAT
jgi:hypothetical protein